MTSSLKCPDSLPVTTTVTHVRKLSPIAKNTSARTNASVADFLPFVPKGPVEVAKTAIDSSRANGVKIITSNLEAAPVPYVCV